MYKINPDKNFCITSILIDFSLSCLNIIHIISIIEYPNFYLFPALMQRRNLIINSNSRYAS